MSLKIIAGTGHRPGKLGNDPLLLNRLTDLAMEYLGSEAPNKVITGMALGWDIALAIAAIKLEIHVMAAIPFKDQNLLWKNKDKILYNNILSKCTDKKIICDGGYSASKLMIRNKYMVDNATKIVALYDGISAGGTANCIKYAVSRNIPIDNMWERYLNKEFGY